MIPNFLEETPEQATRRIIAQHQDRNDADLMRRFTPWPHEDSIGPAPWQWASEKQRNNFRAFAGIFEDRPD